MDARFWGYLKPALIFASLLAIRFFFKLDGIAVNLIIILVYLVACRLLSVITRSDVSTISSEIHAIIKRVLKRKELDPAPPVT